MGKNRALLFASILAAAALGVACVGSDDSGGSSTDDGGTSDGSPSDAGFDSCCADASQTLEAKANDVDVYILQTAVLDATASTPSGASFSWQLASAPGGSSITTASIANATSPTPSFVPDALGTYTLTLKVTSGGASATKNVNVRAFSGKAFLSHGQSFTDGGTRTDVVYVPTFGGDGGTTTISCETPYIPKFTSASGNETDSFAFEGLPTAMDWTEGAPADEAKVAFGFREVGPDGGYTNYLATGTSSTQCATLQKLDAVVNTGDVPQGLRISPAGDRVAFIRQTGSSIDVATIGLDGSNLRVLGSVYRNTDGGAGTLPTSTGYSFEKRRVQWIDETHVAWIGIDSDVAGAFNVLTATDSTTPNVTDYMDCESPVTNATSVNEPTIVQFALLADGTVLVSGEVSTVDAGTTGIYALRPNAATKQCELHGEIGQAGENFAISPEGSRVAYTGTDDTGNGPFIFIAPLDGGPQTLVRSNDAGVNYSTGFGPWWVQGGSALIASGGPAVIDGGSTTNAFLIPAAGGALSPVAFSADKTNAYFVATNDWSCSVGAIGSATPAAGIFLSLGLLVMRRRKKKNEKRADS